MKFIEKKMVPSTSNWEIILDTFYRLISKRESTLEPGLAPEPTIKVLIFLALLDSERYMSYEDIQIFLHEHNVIKGKIPKNTLRTSMYSLVQALNKSANPLEVKAARGFFKLEKRTDFSTKPTRKPIKKSKGNAVLLIGDPATSEALEEEIATAIIRKTTLPFKGLFLLDSSARMWQHYSDDETEIRFNQESNAWINLGIKERLLKNNSIKECLNVVGLAVGEGISEIGLLKNIFLDKNIKTVHYLAIEISHRLLRDHIGLIKEMFSNEIIDGRLLCAGVLSDIFDNLRDPVEKARKAFFSAGILKSKEDFLPDGSGLLVTYFGNTIGNNAPDTETETFSIVRSSFPHRPLEFLVGTSIIHSDFPEQYKRNWNDFLVRMPRYLMETKGFIESFGGSNSFKREFESGLSDSENKKRFPELRVDPYAAQHGITGKIYRFYYKLSFDLRLSEKISKDIYPLPSGTNILLVNIMKYDVNSLLNAIKNGMAFNVQYDKKFNAILDTRTGEREYITFSAYIE